MRKGTGRVKKKKKKKMKKLSMEEIDRGEQMEKNVAARSYCRAYREGAIAFNGGHWRGVITMRGREKDKELAFGVLFFY